jgi:hypothetical protein
MEMQVRLGEFTCESIRAEIGPDLESAAGAAVAQYARELQLGGKPLAVPDFPLGSGEAGVPVELQLDPSTEALMAAEAERRGTSVSDLARHAVLVYLADLDRIRADQNRTDIRPSE